MLKLMINSLTLDSLTCCDKKSVVKRFTAPHQDNINEYVAENRQLFNRELNERSITLFMQKMNALIDRLK